MRWEHDIPFAELQSLARKLEATLTAANAQALRLAHLQTGEVVDAFADAQAKMLRFDEFAKRRFTSALEEARVHTLAGDNMLLGCVLSAAVALSQFKRQPRPTAGLLSRQIAFLQRHSTAAPTLWLLSMTSAYAVLGKGAVKHLGDRRKKKSMDV